MESYEVKKIYKFSYGGKFKKVLCKIIHFIYCSILGWLFLLLLAYVFSEINYLLKDVLNDNTLYVIKAIEVYFSLIAYIASLIPAFLPQKVILDDYEVNIRRNLLFFGMYFFRGFNDRIMYCEIVRVSKRRVSLSEFRVTPVSSAIFKMNDMVEIVTDKKSYYVSVQNSDVFVEELIERINNYRRNHNMEEI